MPNSGFPHHRLDAHRVAQALAVGTRRLTAGLPRGFADLRDQANRASHAVARHIAEGAGRIAARDKKNRYVLARAELGECDACLETIGLLGIAPTPEVERLRMLADRIGAMLTGLIRRWGGF